MLSFVVSLAFSAEVAGPWQRGHYADFAVAGAEVHAVWLEGDTLFYAKGAAAPERVAAGVESGEGGEVRPEIVLAGGKVVVVYSTTKALVKAERAGASWSSVVVSPAGAKGPFQAAIAARADGVVVVAGIAWNGKTSAVFVDGKSVFEGGADGVCMCCKPAVTARDGGFVLAFRDADGNRRDIRTLASGDGKVWKDEGDATHGAWSPGGCPTDGPTLTDTTLLVSDARDGKRKIYEVDRYGEHPLPAATDAAERMQPRALADASLTAWVEAIPGKSTLVVRDGPGAPQAVASTPGRMEPGDPVAVGADVWLPWEGETAHVERWVSQAPPF